MATASSFTALPDDVLQRVLLGVALDDHDATAAACRAFRDVIRGPRFLRLRREYGFAERRVMIVCQRFPDTVEIHVAGKRRAVERVSEGLHLSTFYTSTTDGGARLFVSTTRIHGPPYEIFAVDASARQWSPFATLPLSQRLHCTEWHGGLLYVAGGKPDDFGTNLNTLHAFNETTGLWQDLPESQASPRTRAIPNGKEECVVCGRSTAADACSPWNMLTCDVPSCGNEVHTYCTLANPIEEFTCPRCVDKKSLTKHPSLDARIAQRREEFKY